MLSVVVNLPRGTVIRVIPGRFVPDGYEGIYTVPCACRDCFDVAIASDEEPALCHECKESGCEANVEKECQRTDAYGVEEEGELDG